MINNVCSYHLLKRNYGLINDTTIASTPSPSTSEINFSAISCIIKEYHNKQLFFVFKDTLNFILGNSLPGRNCSIQIESTVFFQNRLLKQIFIHPHYCNNSKWITGGYSSSTQGKTSRYVYCCNKTCKIWIVARENCTPMQEEIVLQKEEGVVLQ